MKFALTIETSSEVESRVHLIVDLSNRLTQYFLEKDYGSDVIEILIGVICVAPEFEWFSKIRKPKYVFYRKYIRDNSEIIVDRVFSFDVKIDYESFKNRTDKQNEKMLASEIEKSLSNLESLPKKVRDFDKDRFKEDMKSYLKDLVSK